MILNIFKEYIKIRKEFKIHTFFYYFKKICMPFIFSTIIFCLYYYFFKQINHKNIATALVSINSIVAAFLVLSLTILLTQDIKGKIPNKGHNYKELLINNAEVSVVLVLSSILINLFYMLISNPTFVGNRTLTIEKYSCFLNIISFFSIFSTVLVIQIAIYDLLYISSKMKGTRH